MTENKPSSEKRIKIDPFYPRLVAAGLLAALPSGRDAAPALPPFSDVLPAAEAFLAPAQINYVGKAANLYDLGYTYHGSASVILRYMRMGYLWEHVRVRGGAYGAFCTLDRMGGTLVCASYRDPNVDDTLTAYDRMADYLRSCLLYTSDAADD